MPAVTPSPWGLSRLGSYQTPPVTGPVSYRVDPATQVGVYYDPSGQPIEAGKHGTIKNTQTPRMTNQDGNEVVDGHDPDANQD